MFDNGIQPLFFYTNQSHKRIDESNFLSEVEKAKIYQIFLHYEKWKEEMQAYDFMDVVNHIIT